MKKTYQAGKKHIFFISLLLYTTFGACAQIGINTESPLGVFHIDASMNNTTGAVATRYKDDVIITNSGKVGIGTASPDTQLHIEGNVAIDDGYQTIGYWWSKIAGTGEGRWSAPSVNNTAKWTLSGLSFTFSSTSKILTGTGSLSSDQIGLSLPSSNSMTIPQGRYLVFFSGDIANSEFGELYLKTGSTVLNRIFYTEELSGPSCLLDLSVDTEVYLEYKHIMSDCPVYSYNTQSSYIADFYFSLLFLQLS